MNERRRQALVTYLAALFGVAFVVVLISLIIQINNGNAINATAADKVLSLQGQVQELQTENKNLQAKNDVLSDDVKELQETLLEIQESTEYLENVAYEATAKLEIMEKAQQAYSCLVTMQEAYYNADRETLYAMNEQLTPIYQYLKEEDQMIYFLMLEHMEEVNIG